MKMQREDCCKIYYFVMSVRLNGVDLFFGTPYEVPASTKERCPPNGGYVISIL